MKTTQRFLVRVVEGGVTPVPLTLNGVELEVHSEPLFSSIKPSSSNGQGFGTSSQPVSWHIAKPVLAIGDNPNPWDICHLMVSQGMTLSGGAKVVVFAEPDFAQSWDVTHLDGCAQAVDTVCDATSQDANFPVGAKDDWYRDIVHGQYGALPETADGTGVRIAHLDTGYDPEHASRPVNLETALAKNFVDGGYANDATDRTTGLVSNRGHGTGTLSILAGAPSQENGFPGVAPKASVVPMRVANSVVLFYNSAIAQAFDEVHRLCKTPGTHVDVVTLSMGGLPSCSWADAVNALYEAGVFVVSAAGNNFDNSPTRSIVYPARFNRVVAVCGAMADDMPYANLGPGKMAGNYGPPSKMRTAIAAYTPNIPWARFGCGDVYRFNGAGTSSATPQVAATAALYIQANRKELAKLPQPWMRVEAVRLALFSSAAEADKKMFGKGIIRSMNALATKVADASQLKKEKKDSTSFALLRVLTGMGISGSPNVVQMLELEALQLSLGREIEALLPDPADASTLNDGKRMLVLKALAEHPRASEAMRKALTPLLPGMSASAPAAAAALSADAPPIRTAVSVAVKPVRRAPTPTVRRLQIYTLDPSLGQDLETFTLNRTVAAIRWEEDLRPGPIGEYLEVIDIDPASGCCYEPVDLNNPHLLASDGLAPAESNPQFHQQMVYAVAMKTIEHFERALGRRALWSSHLGYVRTATGTARQEYFVQRLRIYPHALRAQNAYYSPQKKALLMGYFTGTEAAHQNDEQTVFTALSSDIIAHETSHALLDGLHRRFREPTNPDVLAFHEAFADIVALFQHFSLEGALKDALREQIAKRRGNLRQESLLSGIAQQFGRGVGNHGSLREYVDRRPSVKDYGRHQDAHHRGAVLVAAIFDAFLRIYKRKAVTPIRLATSGSEVLPMGVLQADLVDELARIAANVARQMLAMCIRALDYCPPVDITFGDFLRAVITADKHLVPNDPHGYRVAFASAFRARGIYADGVRTVSVDALAWEPPPPTLLRLGEVISTMSVKWDLETDRHSAWKSARDNAEALHCWLSQTDHPNRKLTLHELDEVLTALGLYRLKNKHHLVTLDDGSVLDVDLRGIEVHSVRPLQRVGPDGQLLSQMVIELTQSMHCNDDEHLVLRGGCTLIVDLSKAMVTYLVRKRADQSHRATRRVELWASQKPEADDLYRGVGGWRTEPFALLHGVH